MGGIPPDDGFPPELFAAQWTDDSMNYPEGHYVTRDVFVGGRSKASLLAQLTAAGIELNEAARILFTSDQFTTSTIEQRLHTVELQVCHLNFPRGATTPEVHARAVTLGLSLAPLELGPCLRLQYLDQPEGHWGHPRTKHRTPPGAIAVASAPVSEDDTFPKGFYLRRIKGTLWLRGYWADAAHVLAPEDHLIFCQP
jgi:hypothetical protein